MTDMQRFNVNWNGSLRQYEQVLDPRGPYVWASDAEAAIAVLIDDQVKEIAEYVTAIAAAEQQAEYREQSGAAWYHGHEQGQRDMLAKCIAAIEEWALENPYEHPSPNRIITALRALQEKQ